MRASLFYPLLSFFLLLSTCFAQIPAGPWDAFNLAPQSKKVSPAAITTIMGTVNNANNLIGAGGGSATVQGGTYIVLDFGLEVGGIVSLNIHNPDPHASFSLTYTESPLFISPGNSDDSSQPLASLNADGALYASAPLPSGTWTQPAASLRGGFRYLTIFSTSYPPLTISGVTVALSFMPHWDDLTAYQGYFYTQVPFGPDPDFLNKLWYAGAYTVQTNTISPDQARSPCDDTPGWANNASAGSSNGPILVNAAKRDRNVVAADLALGLQTQLVSTSDLQSTLNSLKILYATQASNGALGATGPPLSITGSATYICWTLITTYNYYMYTGDINFVASVWTQHKAALSFLQSFIDGSGLMYVPTEWSLDWGRVGGDGHNSAANALLYRALFGASRLAFYLGRYDDQNNFASAAQSLKNAFNNVLWDSSVGMYLDNDTTTLYPQDGNAFAVAFNLTSFRQAGSVSDGLMANWNHLGAVSPELPDTISPFISGYELYAHFLSGRGNRALKLLQGQWGYMLKSNLTTQSTFVEGLSANGSLSYRAASGYNYDPSYTSHSHSWSTAPTSALTFFILGMQLTSPQGATWVASPSFSGLNAAQGGFSTDLGFFGVSWNITGGYLNMILTSPKGSNGTVQLPPSPHSNTVSVNGQNVTKGPYGAVALVGGGPFVLQSLVGNWTFGQGGNGNWSSGNWSDGNWTDWNGNGGQGTEEDSTGYTMPLPSVDTD